MENELLLTFAALITSIVSIWVFKQKTVPSILFVMSTGLGMFFGVLSLFPVFAIATLAVLLYFSMTIENKSAKIVLLLLSIIGSLALASHAIPGFNNPLIVSPTIVSPGAIKFKLYANFDKGVVSFLLLLLVCERVRSVSDLKQMLIKIVTPILITTTLVFSIALAIGLVTFDPKTPNFFVYFIFCNLFFTVIAEECFFRGLIQAPLSKAFSSYKYGEISTVLLTSLLFALVHLPAGVTYAGITAISGFGAAYVFSKTKRVESSILLHITINLIHISLFSYPFLTS